MILLNIAISILSICIIFISFHYYKKRIYKSKKFLIEITNIAGKKQIDTFEEMINNKSTTEIMMQKYFLKNPELLTPLQILEIQRELRLIKRDLIREVILVDSKTNDRIDFVGIKIQPNSTPVIIEIKRPRHNILDHNTLRLSKISIDLINQLHSYILTLFRYENIINLEKKYCWNISDLLKEKLKEKINLYNKIDDKLLYDLFGELNKMEIKLIAIIGNSSEFGNRKSELLEDARKQFLEKNIVLITYDEILDANRAIFAISEHDDSIQNYFRKKHGMTFCAGTFTRLKKDEIISDELIENVKKAILQNKINVSFFGFGPPPEYSKAYKTPYNFDIRKIADPPMFLGGEEDIKWAGRYNDHWIVIKKRLSEPYIGENILYEFNYPIFDGSTRIT